MARYEVPRPRSRKRALRITLVVVILLVLAGARTVASTGIDYQWWKELWQVDTWVSLYLYGFVPTHDATLPACAGLSIALSRLRVARNARNRSADFQAGGRARIQVFARRASDRAARSGGSILPRAL